MNFFLVILIFDGSNLCTDICKTIFVILEVNFHNEGGLSKSRYFQLFFSSWSILSPRQKSASTEAPFNLFWTLTVICFLKKLQKNWYKIWVITISKSAKFLAWGVYWKRNKGLLLTFFLAYWSPCPIVHSGREEAKAVIKWDSGTFARKRGWLETNIEDIFTWKFKFFSSAQVSYMPIWC